MNPRRVTLFDVVALVALLAAAAIVLLAVLAHTPRALDPYLQTFGRMHSLLVHFPIALLLVGFAIDLVRRRKDGDCGDAAWSIVVLGAFFAVLAAGAGWANAGFEAHGSAQKTLLAWHRWFGVGIASCALIATLAGFVHRTTGRAGPLFVYRFGMVAAALGIVIGGHLGGELVYGEGYVFEPLTKRAAPAPTFTSVTRIDVPGVHATVTKTTATIDFAAQIRPLLDRNCVECHREGKKKGNLRLDIPTARAQGQGDEPVIVPGDPGKSELIRRVKLPPEDEDVMPPSDKKDSLKPDEIALLEAWIRQGARWDGEVAEAPAPEPATDPSTDAERNAALEQLKARGCGTKVTIAEGVFELALFAPPAAFGDEDLEKAAALGDWLVELDLSGTAVSEDGLSAAMARLRRLRRLQLAGTILGNPALAAVARVGTLEMLDVRNTRVTDAGLDNLASMLALKELYVEGAPLSPEAIHKLEAALPALKIVPSGAPPAAVISTRGG